MKHLFRPFHRLQWKLTFSYIWITIVTQVFLVFTVTMLITELGSHTFSNAGIDTQKQEASQIAAYRSQTPPNPAALEVVLQKIVSSTN